MSKWNRGLRKNRSSLLLGAVAAGLGALVGGNQSRAATLYWDTNGTGTAGSGAATGTWGTSVFWTTDSTGANVGSPVLTAFTSNADDLVFSAGTTGTAGTVTVSGTQSAHSITFDDAVTVSLSGGTAIDLGSATAGSGLFLTNNGTTTVSTAIILDSAATAVGISNSGTATLTTGSITGSATSGTQALTIGTSAAGNINIGGGIGDGAAGGNVSVLVNSSGAGSVTLSGSNTYTGATSISTGKLVLAGSLNSSSPITIGSGVSSTASLTINSGVTVGSTISLGLSSAASTSNLTNNGTISTNLVIPAGSGTIAVQANAVISGNVTLNGGSSTSSGGTIKDDGQLTIAGSTAVTLGTITSTGTGKTGTGALYYNNTNATGNTVVFAPSTSLAWLSIGANAVGTFQTSGTVDLYAYGQGGAGAFNITLNGGTWNVGQVGQNNSNKTSLGTTNILGGATFNLATVAANGWTGIASASNGGTYMHGIWNVGGASSGTLNILGGFSENGGPATAPVAGATNGLQFVVGNGGSLTTTSASVLGLVVVQAAGYSTTNSIVVNSGGLVTTVGNLTLGGSTNAQTNSSSTNSVTVNTGGTFSNSGGILYIGNQNLAHTQTETNIVTVAGGTLSQAGGAVSLGNSGTSATNYANALNITSGTLTVGTSASTQALQVGTANNAASNTVTNTVSLSGGKLVVSGTISALAGTNQTNTFNWTGGQLTAGSITPGATFATPAGGGISSTTVNNTAGTFAPGDIGTGGKTTISGGYSQGASGALAIDIGSTTAATAFQSGAAFYDTITLQTSNQVLTLGGTLNLSLINSFTPTSGQTYTIVSGATSTSGNFTNVDTLNNRVNVSNGGSFVFTRTGTGATLTLYSTGSDLIWTGGGTNQWDVGTSSNFTKDGVATTFSNANADIVNFTQSGIANNTINLNTTVTPTSATFANTSGTYTVTGSGKISGAATVSVQGGGKVVMGTANDYTGSTSVTANSILNIQAGTALGGTGTGTTVASGSALQLQGGITIGAESLAISGTGISSDGALRNISGVNEYGGLLTLGSAIRINSDAGSLSLTNAGTITGATFGLTVGGAGDTSIASIIGTTAGTVTKDGAGTLTLSGVNTFTGLLSVQQGTLSIPTINNNAANGVLGNSSSSVSLGNTGGVTGTLAYTGATASSSKKFTLTTGGIGGFNVTQGGSTLTASGLIDGAGSLVVNGTGTLLLSGANTFGGGTTLSGGTLALGVSSVVTAGAIVSGPVGTGTLTLAGGTLQDNGSTRTVANNVSVGGSVTFSSTGSTGITFNGTTNTVPAVVSINASNPTLTVNNTLTINDVVSNGTGTSGITKAGAGTLSLVGVNTFTGGVSVSAGTLNVGGVSTNTGSTVTGSATGTGNVTFASGTTLSNNNGTTWFVPQINLAGAGSTLAITGNNRLTISFSTLDLGDTSRTGLTTINVNSKSMAVTGGNTLTSESTGLASWEIGAALGSAVVRNGTLDLQTTTFTGTNYGAFRFNNGPTWTNSAINVGSNVILLGSLGVGSATGGPALTVASGSIYNMTSTTGGGRAVLSLAGAGSVLPSMVTTATAVTTLNITGTTGTTTFSGLLADSPGAGTLALAKLGASNQVLSGANTFSAGVTVSGGTLTLTNTTGSATGSGAVAVNAAGTLAGTGSANGMVTVANSASAHIAPGVAGVGTLSAGGLTLSAASSVDFEFGTPGASHASPGTSDLVAVSGDLVLDGVLNIGELVGYGPGTYQLFTYGGTLTDNGLQLPGYVVGTIDIGTTGHVYLDLTSVPEPTSLSMIGLAAAGMLSRRRRRQMA